MKIFLLITIGLCVFYMGFLFTKYYLKQLEIYKELIKLCEILSSQIKFKQSSLKIIVSENLELFHSDLKRLMQDYFINENKNIKSMYLNNYDTEQIINFFNSLGKFDVEGEINNIQNQKVIFDSCLSDKQEKNKKFGTLGTKLGALLGVLVFIIFM